MKTKEEKKTIKKAVVKKDKDEKGKKVKNESKKEAESKESALSKEKERYFEAVGRRKTAIARVRLYTKKKEIIINDKKLKDYFSILRWQEMVVAPLKKMKVEDKLGATIKVKGGGPTAQAEAILHGIARALIKFNPTFKKRLKRAGYLTRDPRMVERKKPGKRKARRSTQWRKR